MAKEVVHTEIEGRKLKISNLQKVIYPDTSVTKAEIIQYYLSIAPIMLKYVKDRPLTLIRFPDGIHKGHFYTKSKPDWTPTWIKSIGIKHSEETIEYLLAHESATLVWLANLAALEIHPMQMFSSQMEKPDHFIFDLDPPVNGDFQIVKKIAFELKEFLESKGYIPFVKTSGSKGLHIFVPIVPEHTHEEMVIQVKTLAKIFVKQHSTTCTLAMSKEKRGGKTLIDIFRNHKAHTTVAPYSMRGKEGAPLSFPITWEALKDIHHSKDITIRNYQEYLDKFGDVWDSFYEDATDLIPSSNANEIDPKVAEKLDEYIRKRDFDITPEPSLAPIKTKGNQFCVQLHNAQNLHYDLRLEKDGVLLSWAIPKGLPTKIGLKRLAIRTEDHPMKYLDFEGVIPKGQYGAGEMWVYARGTFSWDSQKDGSYKFTCKAPGLNRSYKIYRTKDAQWIIEMIDNADFKKIELPIEPMLAGVSKALPKGSKYSYEIKWDGIRTIVHVNGKYVTIYSRSGRDISEHFPELMDPDLFEIEQGIFDGEIVCLDEQGRPMFSQVISRMHTKGEASIKLASKKNPAVCYLFDCIMLDGKYIVKEPLLRRQAWMNVAFKSGNIFRKSESMDDGQGLFDAAKAMSLEGVMAKSKNGPYLIGQRSDHWLKVKFRTNEQCYIAGYTKGEGDRSGLFGSMHLLKPEDDGSLKYMGKVGTGFDAKKMKMLLKRFESVVSKKKLFPEKTDDDRNSVWLKPEILCEIQYASLSSTGTYREPVFVKLIDKK